MLAGSCATSPSPAGARNFLFRLNPPQALQEIAKTRQVLIFDNALTGLSGALGPCSRPPSLSRTACEQANPDCCQSVPHCAADTLAAKRSLRLSIPFMASSTLELIAALRFPLKPDVLG